MIEKLSSESVILMGIQVKLPTILSSLAEFVRCALELGPFNLMVEYHINLTN